MGMEISSVKPHDLVQIDNDAVCFVTEVIREPRRTPRLRLRSTTGKWSPPTVTAHRVTGIWHANKPTRAAKTGR